MLPPAPFAEPQARADLHNSSYRLPPQLQSRSLLLQLLPAGSAQSLNQLMSRAASGASADFNPQESIARSCSLNNDITTSVSVSSPKRSLLDMSRAVSEQLHLTSTSKAVQRPFLADLQQKWTAGHQVSFHRISSCQPIWFWLSALQSATCIKHTSALYAFPCFSTFLDNKRKVNAFQPS
jgi:hypothetical protein